MRTRMRDPLAATVPAGNESVVERLRRGIAEAGLDCGCRDAANDAIDRACLEEEFKRRAGGLADARRMRDAIVLVVALLGELDELTPDEPDRTTFHEIVALFSDVGDFAAFGATAAIRAAGQGNA